MKINTTGLVIIIGIYLVCLHSNINMAGSLTGITPLVYVFVSNIVKFVTPTFSRDEWSTVNKEIKDKLSVLHFDLANDLISPADAGNQFSEITHSVLANKPEFLEEQKENGGYIKNKPKTINDAKKTKKRVA